MFLLLLGVLLRIRLSLGLINSLLLPDLVLPSEFHPQESVPFGGGKPLPVSYGHALQDNNKGVEEMTRKDRRGPGIAW